MSLDYFKTCCKVCGNEGHGHHFGVESCRACAAFFRRSGQRKEDYVCRVQNGHCDLKKSNCKACRLRKCQMAGMTTDKRTEKRRGLEMVRHDPKVIKEYEERVEYVVWHPITKKPARLIDINPILRRSKKILETFHPPVTAEFEEMNPLQKMTYSLKRLRGAQSKTPEFKLFMPFDDYFFLWEEHMTRAAEWLMHSEEFRELPEHEKLEFFKIVWAVWRRVERNNMAANVFGKQSFDERILLISDDTATRLNDFRMDVSEICDGGFEKYRNVMLKNLVQYFDIVVKTSVEWKFTDEEVTFAISNIVWNYAGRRLLGQTQAAGERFLEKISNNLHDYYTKVRDMSNYAGRLTVIMEMVNAVLKMQLEHEKTMEMAFLFDMFNVVFSDQKFFCV